MPRLTRDVLESLEYNQDTKTFEDLTPYEKLDTFLHWNGIQGWTSTILNATIESGINLEDYR